MAATEGEMMESNRDMTAKAMIPARIPRFRRVNTLPDTSPDIRFPLLINFSNLSLFVTVYPRPKASHQGDTETAGCKKGNGPASHPSGFAITRTGLQPGTPACHEGAQIARAETDIAVNGGELRAIDTWIGGDSGEGNRCGTGSNRRSNARR